MMEHKNHQPYELWLYENDGLTIKQRAMLHQHLRECTRCRQIQRGWEEIMHRISRSQFERPSEGFSRRWRISVEARRAIQMRRQTWSILLWLSVAAFVSLSILALQVGTGTPFELFLTLIKTSARLLAEIYMLFQVMITILRPIPITITIMILVILICIFSYLTHIWVKTFTQVFKHGV